MKSDAAAAASDDHDDHVLGIFLLIHIYMDGCVAKVQLYGVSLVIQYRLLYVA